jgi:hypothetical protein
MVAAEEKSAGKRKKSNRKESEMKLSRDLRNKER